jgi:DNA repair protein RadC
MPRGRRERHSPYQLSFDLERDRIQRESTAAYRRAALDLTAQSVETRRFVRQVQEEVVVRSPRDAAHHLIECIFTPFEQFEQEEFWVLLLNTKNRVTHEVMVYRGTTNTILVRVAEIFREAIRHNAVALILSHCHPSGDPTPSPEDVRLTQAVNEAASLVEIDVFDHIVLGDGRWISMKERGLGFR